MCENTKGRVGRAGAVPGASTDLSPHSTTGKEGNTEQRSVENAIELSPDGVNDGRVGNGKELPPPTVRWCLDCLDEGVRTALALDGPSRELCEAHRRERVSVEDLKACVRSGECARKGCDRPRGVNTIWCRVHATCDASVSCDNLPAIPVETEQPNDQGAHLDDVMADALEAGWVALADDHRLDPMTVAACKRLRDLEGRVRS